MPEPVRTTIFAFNIFAFVLILIGVVTPFWGSGVVTRMDKNRGIIENLFENPDSTNFLKVSIWNSESWWPEVNVIGRSQSSGNLVEAKIIGIFAILFAVAGTVVQAVYTFRTEFHDHKILAVNSGCIQTIAGFFACILCAIMGGCLNNKMASNPLFQLGDSFIITVIGGILYIVCGLFTMVHFVYSAKELVKDRLLLLAHPDYAPTQYNMPPEAFPTSTSIVAHQ